MRFQLGCGCGMVGGVICWPLWCDLELELIRVPGPGHIWMVLALSLTACVVGTTELGIEISWEGSSCLWLVQKVQVVVISHLHQSVTERWTPVRFQLSSVCGKVYLLYLTYLGPWWAVHIIFRPYWVYKKGFQLSCFRPCWFKAVLVNVPSRPPPLGGAWKGPCNLLMPSWHKFRAFILNLGQDLEDYWPYCFSSTCSQLFHFSS